MPTGPDTTVLMNFNIRTSRCFINTHSNETLRTRHMVSTLSQIHAAVSRVSADSSGPDAVLTMEERPAVVDVTHKKTSRLPPFNCTRSLGQRLHFGERLTSNYSKLIRLSGSWQNKQQQTTYYNRLTAVEPVMVSTQLKTEGRFCWSSFTACTPLLMATSTIGLGRRRLMVLPIPSP